MPEHIHPTMNQVSDTLGYCQKDEVICAHFDIYTEEGSSKFTEVFMNLSLPEYNYFKAQRAHRNYRGDKNFDGVFQFLQKRGIIIKEINN